MDWTIDLQTFEATPTLISGFLVTLVILSIRILFKCRTCMIKPHEKMFMSLMQGLLQMVTQIVYCEFIDPVIKRQISTIIIWKIELTKIFTLWN